MIATIPFPMPQAELFTDLSPTEGLVRLLLDYFREIGKPEKAAECQVLLDAVMAQPPPAVEAVKVATKGPLMKKAEEIFRPGKDRPFTVTELRAFKNNRAAILATSETEWDLLREFYNAPQRETYSRKSFDVLLNNWNSEIDRAKAWKRETQGSYSNQPKRYV